VVKISPECVTGPDRGKFSGRVATGCYPNWHNESRKTFEETSGYVRSERVNKWPNCMTDI